MPIASNPIAEISQFDKERFWGKVEIKSKEECWNWKFGLFSNGYGQFRVNGKTVKAHRISFLLENKYIDPSKFVMHKCDNRSCVNPSHLMQGLHSENMADMRLKNRAAKGDKNGTNLYPEKLKRGESHHLSKLTEKDVIEAREIYASNVASLKTLADFYGVSKFVMRIAVSGKTWKHVPLAKLNEPAQSGLTSA